jgi:L-ascorbate metabolism protein UlaG (beta-lactamase superfamily)
MSLTARWLGQAGFLLSAGDDHLLMDAYLSNSLAEKYAGTTFPHIRMQEAPLAVADLPPLLAVTCSHAHTDHMDPETLQPLMAAQPDVRLVGPRAVVGEALRRSAAHPDRVDALGERDRRAYGPFTVTAVPSAHEHRETDELGDDRFLGYVLQTPSVTVYHSGDCVPWDGLAAQVQALGVQVALLPVNGRDDRRRDNGVPGNFTFAEAVELCAQAGVSTLVPHHWGMFDFNTVDPETFDIERAAAAGVRVVVPEHGRSLDLAALVA